MFAYKIIIVINETVHLCSEGGWRSERALLPGDSKRPPLRVVAIEDPWDTLVGVDSQLSKMGGREWRDTCKHTQPPVHDDCACPELLNPSHQRLVGELSPIVCLQERAVLKEDINKQKRDIS